MTWEQPYNPLGHIGISTLVALIPLIVLGYLLVVQRVSGYIAAFGALLTSIIIAFFVYQMPLVPLTESVVSGSIYGIFPVFWIIFTAIFVYNLSLETGQFEVIKSSITLITEDRRLQVLLIGFCFGAFIEGAAGFGAPVAITAGLLVGLGFKPLHAAGLCLLANTAPVAFGSIGIPVIVAANVTGLNASEIAATIGRQLPFLSLIIPFWIVFLLSGWKATCEVAPACWVVGISFALIQFLVSNYLGPELPDILSSLGSILAMLLLLQYWKPKSIWRFEEEKCCESQKEATTDTNDSLSVETLSPKVSLTPFNMLKAWSPFLLLTIFVVLWGMKPIHDFLDTFTLAMPMKGLHHTVVQMPPVVVQPKPIEAVVKIAWLSSAGTAIFFAGLLSAFLLRLSVGRLLCLYYRTGIQLIKPLLNIACVLGVAYLMNASGMSTTFALLLAGTGGFFPFFSPLIGWLGVFLTGSDTTSNALFGNLQTVTAGQVNMNPVLAIAANSSGGVTGKMISPLSLAVGSAATGLIGKEGDLIRFTLLHSIIFALSLGLLTWLQTGILAWMIP